MTEKDFKLADADITALDTNYQLDAYGMGFALQVEMCSSTEYWQDKVSGVADRVVNELNMDGVYLDQVTCTYAKPCYDRNHNHSIGGGDYMVHGF